MAFDAGAGAVRELLVVLLLAGTGLLLALAAAFTPWHPPQGGTAPAVVIELRSPVRPAAGVEPSAPAGVESTRSGRCG